MVHELSFQFRACSTPKSLFPSHPAAELLSVQSTVGGTYLTTENQALTSQFSICCSIPELQVYDSCLWTPENPFLLPPYFKASNFSAENVSINSRGYDGKV